MMTLARSLALSATLLLATPAAAAVLTVGPNGTFADIADAVAVAQPNDVILVEPGVYGQVEIDIPLRVMGDGTGDVIISTFAQRGIIVRDLAAGEEVVLSGLKLEAVPVLAPVQASIHVLDCAGTVVIHDTVVDFLHSYPCVHAQNSDRVMILGSEMIEGGPLGAVIGENSDLWIADTTVVGLTPNSGFVEAGDDAVRISNGELHVWRSTIRGGDGAGFKPAFGITPHGGDGIDAVNADVVLYGGPIGGGGGAITGGNGHIGSFFGGPGDGGAAIRLTAGSTAKIQSAIPLSGGVDGPGLVTTQAILQDGTSSSTLDPTVYPTLVTSAPFTSVGGGVALQVDGTPGSIAVWFASFSTGTTISIPGVLGLGSLNPSLFVQLAITPLDGAGTAILPASVPPAASLLGTAFHFQAAEAAGAQIAITNPAVVVVTQ